MGSKILGGDRLGSLAGQGGGRFGWPLRSRGEGLLLDLLRLVICPGAGFLYRLVADVIGSVFLRDARNCVYPACDWFYHQTPLYPIFPC